MCHISDISDTNIKADRCSKGWVLTCHGRMIHHTVGGDHEYITHLHVFTRVTATPDECCCNDVGNLNKYYVS